MIIGVTGTRYGCSPYQLQSISEYFSNLNRDVELHHGDCKGVDVEVARIAQDLDYWIVCHPPILSSTRGFFGGNVVLQEQSYMTRDRAIVDACDLLLVVPLQMEWQPRGGTWYTHDYAKRIGKPIKMFWPMPNENLLDC